MTELERQRFGEWYESYYDLVYRVCYSFMKNRSDTEDAVAETFMKLLPRMADMENEKHLKGWLVVTASNYCKNQLKHWWRKKRSSMEVAENNGREEPSFVPNETLEAVLKLPDRYKAALYLHYYEGYSSAEIGEMTGRSASTVRGDLQKARKLLGTELNEEL